VTFTNPYPGRPYHEAHPHFYGRETETDDIYRLIVANALVILHAVSGAGKTSLINASLIPRLRKENLQVLPKARVNDPLPLGEGALGNVFSQSVIRYWQRGGWGDTMLSEATLREMSLADYLATNRLYNETSYGTKKPRVVIIDQAEEIFSLHKERWADRRPFFEQIQAALVADRYLRILLALRTDYLGYFVDNREATSPLEGMVETRIMIQPLDKDQVIEVIRRPMEATGFTFSNADVVEALKTELMTESSPTHEFGYEAQYAKPILVQLRLYKLWDKLRTYQQMTISEDVLSAYPIRDTLREIYEDAIALGVVRNVSGGLGAGQEGEGLAEAFCYSTESLRRLIRERFLAGEARIMYEATSDANKNAYAVLKDAGLLTDEKRGERDIYELSHDSFVAPVKSDIPREAVVIFYPAGLRSASDVQAGERAWLVFEELLRLLYTTPLTDADGTRLDLVILPLDERTGECALPSDGFDSVGVEALPASPYAVLVVEGIFEGENEPPLISAARRLLEANCRPLLTLSLASLDNQGVFAEVLAALGTRLALAPVDHLPMPDRVYESFYLPMALGKLHEAVNKPTIRERVVGIVGDDNLGKSQLVWRLARHCDVRTLFERIERIVEGGDSPLNPAQLVTDEKLLIILDDVALPGTLLNTYLREDAHYTILVTTRERGVLPAETTSVVEMVFSDWADVESLFRGETPSAEGATPDAQSPMTEIAQSQYSADILNLDSGKGSKGRVGGLADVLGRDPGVIRLAQKAVNLYRFDPIGGRTLPAAQKALVDALGKEFVGLSDGQKRDHLYRHLQKTMGVPAYQALILFTLFPAGADVPPAVIERLLTRTGEKDRLRRLLELELVERDTEGDLYVDRLLYESIVRHDPSIAALRRDHTLFARTDFAYLAARVVSTRRASVVEAELRDLLNDSEVIHSEPDRTQLAHLRGWFARMAHVLDRADDARTVLQTLSISAGDIFPALRERVLGDMATHLRATQAVPQIAAVQIRGLVGYTEGVRASAISPDGRQVVGGSDKGEVILWEVDTGAKLRAFDGHKGLIADCAFTPDGRYLASAGLFDGLRVWDRETGEAVFEEDELRPVSVHFSADGTLLLVTDDRTENLFIYDIQSSPPKVIGRVEGHADAAMSSHPDGRLILTTKRNQVFLYDRETLTVIHQERLAMSDGEAWGCALSADERYFAFGTSEGKITLGSVAERRILDTKEVSRVVTNEGRSVFRCVFSHDGRYLFNPFGAAVQVWHISESGTLEHVRELAGHTGELWSITTNDGGNRLVTGSLDTTVKVWDMAQIGQANAQMHEARVWGLSAAPLGVRGNVPLIATGALDRTARLWKAEEEDGIWQVVGIAPHNTPVIESLLSSSGERLYTFCNDKTMHMWDVRVPDAPLRQSTLAANSWSVNRAILTKTESGSDVLIGIGDDKTVYLLNADLGKIGSCYVTNPAAFVSDAALRYTVDGKPQLLTAWSDATARLFDLDSLNTPRPHLNREFNHSDVDRLAQVSACAFAPDGRLAVTAVQVESKNEYTLYLWNMEDFRRLREIGRLNTRHKSRVHRLAVSPDGNYLASLEDAGALRVWSFPTGELVTAVYLDEALSNVLWLPMTTNQVGSYPLVATGRHGVYFLTLGGV